MTEVMGKGRETAKGETHYSIHRFLHFSLRTTYRRPMSMLPWSLVMTQYEAFRSPSSHQPDLEFSMGPFVPDLSGCVVLDGKTYVRENYLCTVASYKVARFQLEISGWEEGTLKVRVACNEPGFLMLSGFVMDPLILYSLTRRQVFPIHAACVADGGSAFLFAGSSGTGKTSTCVELMEDGYRLLGDNYTLLSDGHAYGFLSPLNIFTYNLSPGIRERMSSAALWSLRLKHQLWRLTGGYVKIFTKLNPAHIWPEQTAQTEAVPKAIFLLISSTRFQVSSISPATLATVLMANMRLEIPGLLEWLAQYSFTRTQLNVPDWTARYEAGLVESLSQVPNLLRVEIPGPYDGAVTNRIRGLMDEIKGGA